MYIFNFICIYQFFSVIRKYMKRIHNTYPYIEKYCPLQCPSNKSDLKQLCKFVQVFLMGRNAFSSNSSKH